MPPADELILKEVTAFESRDGGGRIVVSGLSRRRGDR